ARGGMTSHAAVVARGMGKCCVVGCEAIRIDEGKGSFTANGATVREGDWISLDGTTGRVLLGKVRTIEPDPQGGEFAEFMRWADKERRLGVRANADIPRDAQVARRYGAEGIGLCRTEHMFFAEGRLPHMQAMILAETEAERRAALARLLPMQREDFKGLFKAMDGLPVTIRFLDPPLHEFLPRREELQAEIAALKGQGDSAELARKEKLLARLEELHEFNPMLGTRGCRLGITYPEISEMQARAVFEAACEATGEGVKAIPEVMIPLVGHVRELELQRELVEKVAQQVFAEKRRKVPYLIGTMIELPRAALTAAEVARAADFFSFGTNDLTQTTFGLSRDDTGRIIREYERLGIYKDDPFQTLDATGVGQLVRLGTERGRQARPKLKVGICGEHGGDPASVEFCHQVGLNYVSCSPYRVPVARLAAAQAALKERQGLLEGVATTA
ncbi:MAG: putative PEP-binding protein, partial [Candidatus Acidiferrales bacterium]